MFRIATSDFVIAIFSCVGSGERTVSRTFRGKEKFVLGSRLCTPLLSIVVGERAMVMVIKAWEEEGVGSNSP